MTVEEFIEISHWPVGTLRRISLILEQYVERLIGDQIQKNQQY